MIAILTWYQYKIIDTNTNEYETFLTFYKRFFGISSAENDNIELTTPLTTSDDPDQQRHHRRTDSEQDPLTLLQWKIQPGQLHLGQRIGAGGCGWIYQGTLGFGTSVKIACKEVISATIDPDDLKEFEHEARMMAQLHHPFVIKFYGVCTKIMNNEQTQFHDEQRMYMVTELAGGGSLEQRIKQGTHMKKIMKTQAATSDMKMPFDGMQATCWALQIAAGMSHIHSRYFVHRDLKPHNILLNDSGEQGNAIICDLGTAKNMTPGAINFERAKNEQLEYDPEAAPNMTTMTGTPMYMAPEVFKSKVYTSAVDVWSYGVLLVRLFTLESPYPQHTTSAQLIKGVGKNEMRPTDVERSMLPHPEIKDVIDGCLKFEASERLTFVEIEKIMSKVLAQMESERNEGGVGNIALLKLLSQHRETETESMAGNNINMTLTSVRGETGSSTCNSPNKTY